MVPRIFFQGEGTQSLGIHRSWHFFDLTRRPQWQVFKHTPGFIFLKWSSGLLIEMLGGYTCPNRPGEITTKFTFLQDCRLVDGSDKETFPIHPCSKVEERLVNLTRS